MIDFVPLVGMRYRPPAAAILSVLPAGAALHLRPEPSNPFDANAIQVLVATMEIPEGQREGLALAAAPFGFTIEEILAADEWHLGYVKRECAAESAARWRAEPNIYCNIYLQLEENPEDYIPGRLIFDPAGRPLVEI